ncbi:MAG: hypothetical protein NTV87_09175 [Ignavibacteriae bacterium]|nr:hypothetical protein [Ignavibacteriota bacterium]
METEIDIITEHMKKQKNISNQKHQNQAEKITSTNNSYKNQKYSKIPKMTYKARTERLIITQSSQRKKSTDTPMTYPSIMEKILSQ